MAKQLNKNVTAALTGVVAIIITLLMVLMLYQLKQTDPAPYVQRAKAAERDKHFEEAAQFYQQAYQVANQDATYLLYAGDAMVQAGQESKAIGLWRGAVTQRPDLLPAWERILGLYLEFAHTINSAEPWQSVKKSADELLRVNAQNALALYARGRAKLVLQAENEGYAADGTADLERAHEIAPENTDYAHYLALRYRELKRLPDAEKIYQATQKLNDQPGASASAIRYNYAAFLDQAGQRDEEALKLYDEALRLAGDEPAQRAKVSVETAGYWIRRWSKLRANPDGAEQAAQAFERADRLLAEAGQIDPESFDPALLRSAVYSTAGRIDDAIAAADVRLAGGEISRVGQRGRQAKFRRFQLLIEAAHQVLSKLEVTPADAPARRELLAKTQGRIDDAEGEFPKTAIGLHLAARLKLAAGDSAAALALAQEADAASAGAYWANKKLLAVLLNDRRQTGEALKCITQAVADDSADLGSWVLFAQLLMTNIQPKEAVAAADQALKRWPGQKELMWVKLNAFQKLGKDDLAEAVRKDLEAKITAEGAAGPPPALLNVIALQDAGRVKDAIAACEAVLKDFPTDPVVVQRAVQLYALENRFDDARQAARRALEQDPQSAALQRLKAGVDILANTDLSEDERSRQMLEFLDRTPDPLDRARQKATWFVSLRRWPDAFAQLEEAQRLANEKGAAAGGQERALRQIVDQQFTIALEIKDDAAKQRRERVARSAAELNIDGADGLSYRGRLHLLAGEFDQALEAFRTALEKQPANSRIQTLQGRAFLALKRTSDAQASLERATELNPNEADAQYLLAGLAADAGDSATLALRLKVCERLIPNDPWVREKLIEQKELENPAQGIERREALRTTQPDDWRNLLLLARLYAVTGQPAKADACFQDARKANPANSRVVYDWFRFLDATNRPDDALALLQEFAAAATEKPEQALAQLMIGQHYAALRQLDQADAAFLKAADLNPTTNVFNTIAQHYVNTGNRLDKAAEWFRKAIERAEAEKSPRVKSLSTDLLTVLIAQEAIEKAKQEIEKFLTRFPGDASGLLARAEIEFRGGHVDDAVRTAGLVLSREANHAEALLARARYEVAAVQWTLAITDLENLRALVPEAAGFRPRILLSALYARVGRLDVAVHELESILEKYPDAADVAIALIQLYARHERLTDAQRVTTSWINRRPSEPRWYQARADLELRAKDTQRALADYARACTLSQYHPMAVARYLEVCLSSGQLEDGIRLFEDKVPEPTHVAGTLCGYASLLAKKGDVPAAVTQFRRALARVPDDLTQIIAVANSAATAFGPARALELFRDAPDDPAAQRCQPVVIATLNGLAGENSTAIEQLKALLSKATDAATQSNFAVQIAALYSKQGEHQNARHYYEETLRLTPQNLSALNNLAFLLCDTLNEPQKAVPYARKAVQIQAEGAVLDTLGWAYYKSGQLDDAIGTLSQAVQTSPDLTIAYLHLIEAYCRRGDFSRAEALLTDTLTRIAKTPEEAAYRSQIEGIQQRIAEKNQKP